jgi:phosphate transport system ATP-binding protein
MIFAPHGTPLPLLSVAQAPPRSELQSHPVEKIIVRDLDFYYDAVRALTSISIRFFDKSVTALMGPSGCGKSTLLRVLNRMYELYPGQRATGEVLMDGRNILDPSYDLTDLRRRVGMVFQKPTPLPMSIYDNVAFGLRLYAGASRSELDRQVELSLRRAHLWDEVKDVLRRHASALSIGQQQRLTIARTIAVGPDVLLLDEPCSALDPVSTSGIENLIDELRHDCCVIIVTHNLQQAARVSNYTGFMYNGALVEFDTTSTIFTRPKDPHTEAFVTGRFG